MSELATLRIVVSADDAIRVVDRFGNAVEDAARQTDALTASAKRVGTVVGGVLAAGFALAVKETVDAQREQAALATILDRTGQAAGRSLDQLNAHADALRRVTAFGGGDIAETQARLLSYTALAGDNFDRATQAALDFATAYGTSGVQAAEALGKALNFPREGLAALSKQGFIFTDSQKAVIASLVETNRLAEAQTIILAEVESVVDGQAAAYRNTLGGALGALRESFLDLFEVSSPGMQELTEDINILADSLATIPTRLELIKESFKNVFLQFDSFFDLSGGDRSKGPLAAVARLEGREAPPTPTELLAQSDATLAALRTLLAEQQQDVLDNILARRNAPRPSRLGGGAGSEAEAVRLATEVPQEFTNGLKAANDAVKDFARTIDENLTRKAVADLKRGLEDVKHANDVRDAKAREQFKARLSEIKATEDALTETSRVFVEQTQMAVGRFASDFLKDGFRSLDRFWGDFVQLGRDAIGNVFAKSVMDRLGDGIGERLSGALSGMGGVGLGVVGVFAGLASAIPDLIGSSKRAFEAAQAQRKAAEDLAVALRDQRRNYQEDFLTFSGSETPLEREIREITGARDTLFRRAFEQFRESAPNASSALFGSDFNLALNTLREQVAASGGYTTDAARTFLQQLEDLAAAFERNTDAARDATLATLEASRARQELTLTEFRDSLALSDASGLSPVARLAEAQRQYEAILALAQGGDASAVDSLPRTAQTLLDAARATFASGTRYQDLFGRVQGDLDTLLADVRTRTFETFVPSPVPIDFETFVPSPVPIGTVSGVEGVVRSTVGFADAVALEAQTDRQLEVANAALAVQQQGFQTVATLLQMGFGDLGTRLQGIDFLLRNRTETAVPSTVGFDYVSAT